MPPNGRKRQKSDQTAAKETIHSGHFMVSDIDDSEVQDGDESSSLVVHESDCDQESSPLPVRGFDFESACKETSKTYTFGPRSSLSISIDASLTKLFECMTLAYSGKLTSPRWKQFKGLKLRLKEKIRLNNMIWRAWHMQFVMKLKTFVCQFASPLEGDTHTKAEAVVIEGTYWKRRMANITAEYQKWRLFYKDRFRLKPSPEAESIAMDLDSRWPPRSKDSFSCFSGSLSGSLEEDFIMDFADTLFSTFNPSQPFDFPNPREIAARAGIADFIQPGLVQLQPSVDDFMDTFEPLQDFVSDFLNSKLPTLPEESTDNSHMADGLTGTSEQEISVFGLASYGNVFNQANLQTSAFGRAKLNNFARKSFSQQRTQHQRLAPSSHSNKFIVNNLMNTSSENSLSQNSLLGSTSLENISGINQTSLQQSITRNDNIQLSCTPSPSQVTLDSILQSDVQTNASIGQVNSLSGKFRSAVMPQCGFNVGTRRERTNQCFQQAPRVSTISSQPIVNIAPKQTPLIQPARPLQVPLSSLSPHQSPGNSVLTQNSPKAKNSNVPLFLTVDLGQPTQALNSSCASTGTFNIPVHLSNVVSTQLPMPLIQQASFGVKSEPSTVDYGSGRIVSSKVKTVETPALRRHSYTTGQQLQAVSSHQLVDNLNSNRRSRLIAPATTSCTQVASFAVPEVPIRQRTRSRSVSSPQGGSPKPFAQQPSQALSLTDISVSPPPHPAFALHSSCGKSATAIPEACLGASSSGSTANVSPQNAVLAQLLSSGRTHRDSSSSANKDISNTAPISSPVTLLQSIPALATTNAHTFVFSPISLATVTGISDFQRSLLVGAANQVFGSPSSSPCPAPSSSPNSPGSSTCSPSPAISSTSFDTTASSSKSLRPKSDDERVQYKEHRRVCHINAEQKRRCNIKNGFEALHHLLPPMNQNPNAKVSKAAMLQKGAEYIRALKSERQQQQEEAEQLKQQIDALNQTISLYQSQLPASGVPVPCQRTNRMKEMFEEYVRQQTLKNWKFWIFSLILEPLVESYNNNVSTANVDEMYKTILSWMDQHCSLVSLRPGVLNSLRHLSTTTNILSDPSCMPEEATRAVTKKESRQQ